MPTIMTEIPYETLAHDLEGVLQAVTDERKTIVVTQASGARFVIKPLQVGKRRRKAKTTADLDVFRSAAGGWSDVDIDDFLDTVKLHRNTITRTPPEL